jgi:hypothetical protein
MAAGGHLLATAGASGSVKLTPEGALRVAAADAGVQLPHSASVVAEALTALLLGGSEVQQHAAAAAAAAVLTTAGSGASSASAVGGLLSRYGSSAQAASASSAGQQQLQQALLAIDEQHARHHGMPQGGSGHALVGPLQPTPRQGSGAALEVGTPPARTPSPLGASSYQQLQQLATQPPLTSAPSRLGGAASANGGASANPTPGATSADATPAGGSAAASSDAGGGSAAPSRERSFARQPSGSWPQQQQLAVDSPWLLRYEDLRLGRMLGEGSYGRVRIGWWRETEVAVKVGGRVGRRGAGRSRRYASRMLTQQH